VVCGVLPLPDEAKGLRRTHAFDSIRRADNDRMAPKAEIRIAAYSGLLR
jgi:hypothetical protein